MMRGNPRRTASRAARPERRPQSSGRETVESFVVVFLIFLVLTFEAEQFAIPTGSMAPTLLGRHKEVTCPQCGAVFTVSADREDEAAFRKFPAARWVVAGTCANCRFQAPVGDEPSFQGDRIYVIKTPLDLPWLPGAGGVRPGRWDVAVFKLPEDPQVRYIKRVAGLPCEVVRIRAGDLWVRPAEGDEPFRRALRPLRHQQAMQMPVYDDRHRARALASDPRWARWASSPPGSWAESSPGRYTTSSGGASWAELRYRHRVPDPEQWAAVVQGRPLPRPPRASLITDFYSYNTDLPEAALHDTRHAARAWMQPHWVGDLTLSFALDVGAPAGLVRVGLVKAGVENRCELDLATGRARLWHGDEPLGPPSPTGVNRPGAHAITFADVDDRLTLWIDGVPAFGEGRSFDGAAAGRAPTAADLEPAAVAARGASVTVRDLVLKRDIYYTLQPAQADLEELNGAAPDGASALFDLLSDPDRFPALGKVRAHDYPIAPGHYLMLGDNSPWSRDSRAWGRRDQYDPDIPTRGWDRSGRSSWEVPEALLIGKAFCVYWPHLRPVWPNLRLGRDVRLPAVPNFGAVRWIR